jgi:hypothetical protein
MSAPQLPTRAELRARLVTQRTEPTSEVNIKALGPPPALLPKKTPADMILAAAAEVAAKFIAPKERRREERRSRTMTKAQVAAARVAMEAISDSGDWSKARPSHFVALYEWFHRDVYGVAPCELETAKEFQTATFAAARLLKQWFNEDASAFVAFMRWVWVRETGRRQWREAQGASKGEFRIGWRLQFSPKFVTDYRVALASSGT